MRWMLIEEYYSLRGVEPDLLAAIIPLVLSPAHTSGTAVSESRFTDFLLTFSAEKSPGSSLAPRRWAIESTIRFLNIFSPVGEVVLTLRLKDPVSDSLRLERAGCWSSPRLPKNGLRWLSAVDDLGVEPKLAGVCILLVTCWRRSLRKELRLPKYSSLFLFLRDMVEADPIPELKLRSLPKLSFSPSFVGLCRL